jgi:hypothetical protein
MEKILAPPITWLNYSLDPRSLPPQFVTGSSCDALYSHLPLPSTIVM